MNYLNNYRGRIPIELYADLLAKYPMQPNETDVAWTSRVAHDPMLAQKMFSTGQFKAELTQAIHRRVMAQAGARRTGQQLPGPALVKLAPGGRIANPVSTIAPSYVKDLMTVVPVNGVDTLEYRYKAAAKQWLLDQFDGQTPVNGSIFWNGIDELALAKLVDEWNTELKGEVFGQLEATTSAQYVNKQFEWDVGQQFADFFTETSERLGHAARGHVTSVVRCGLRNTSIFTTTELPKMFSLMDAQIRRREQPVVTDLTIVVIEPKSHPERAIKAFTNNEITMIPIVKEVPGRRINGRDDCTVESHVGVGASIREYWSRRTEVKESAAAGRIQRDFGKLIKWP